MGRAKLNMLLAQFGKCKEDALEALSKISIFALEMERRVKIHELSIGKNAIKLKA
jgi:hypothetical protein